MTRRGLRRGATIGAIVFGLLVLLWCGYWFASDRIAVGAMRDLVASLAADGRAIDCAQDTTGGFPFSLDLDCGQASFHDTRAGMAVGLTRLTATAPIYWPGSVTAALSAPMAIDGPGPGVSFNANWTRAVADAEAGLSGLSRIVFELNDLAVAAKPDAQNPPFSKLVASRARIAAEPAGGDAYHFALSADDLQIRLKKGGKGGELPALAVEMDVTAHDFGGSLGTNPRGAILAWLARGGTVDVKRLLIALGQSSANASGTLRLSPNGLLSGDLNVRLTGLKQLPKTIGKLRSGSETQVKQLIAAAGMFTKPVEGNKEASDAPVTIRNGVVSIGVIPVGTIPPLRF